MTGGDYHVSRSSVLSIAWRLPILQTVWFLVLTINFFVLFCYRIGSLLFHFDIQKDDILAEREKRVKQLIHQLEMMEIVMNKHRSGDRVMTDDMLSSYRKRRAVYEDQLAEASVELTDEVCMFVDTNGFIGFYGKMETKCSFSFSQSFSHFQNGWFGQFVVLVISFLLF